MASSIFSEGMPYSLISPMYEDGFAIEKNLVNPEFAAEMISEIRHNGLYRADAAAEGGDPGVYHVHCVEEVLPKLPKLREYKKILNETINEVSGYRRDHLTYLTVRVCTVGNMSSRIHRNDSMAGPWLVALTVEGSGSFNIYNDEVIPYGAELTLDGSLNDPVPISSSDMKTGDAWGIYSKEWSAPHAGGMNTSLNPKVLVMLYGWCVREEYPYRFESWQSYNDDYLP